MRTPSLKPKHRAGRPSPWVVYIPPKLSATGRRQELFFATKGEALTICDQLKARRDTFGSSLALMSPARIAEASEAYKLLQPYQVGLLDAVRAYTGILKARHTSVTLGAAFDAFAELKANRSLKYLREIRQVKARFTPVLERLVCDVQAGDLEAVLRTMPASSRNAAMRRLRSIFNLCIKRDWLRGGQSPIAKLDFADVARDEVDVFSVGQVQAMLDHALKHDPEFLAYRVLAFFCGIRPEGELTRLRWEDVSIERREVVLPAAITKTKRKRAVVLSNNAIEWLQCARQATGLVAPWSAYTLREKHRANYRGAGITKWIQQGARHSFCSYWLALHKSIDELVLQSGHDDPKVLWQRYYAHVSDEDARRYWQIRPAKD
jgi:integrase